MSVGIVGAGVIGLSIGFELAEAGHDVTVFDAGQAGGSASAMNAGWVAPFLSTPRAAPGILKDALGGLKKTEGPLKFQLRPDIGFAGWGARFLISSSRRRSARTTTALHALATHAPRHFDQLLERGVEFEHHRDGLGVVFQYAQNLENYRGVTQKMHRLGYAGKTSVYQGSEIADFDPAISRSAAGVIHLEDERHVRPESLSQGLATALRGQGGELQENMQVLRIERAPNARWAVITATGARRLFDRLVIAAGFRSRELLKPLGIRLPLEAAKGVSLTARGEGVLPQHPLKLFEKMVASSPYDGEIMRFSGTFDVGDRSEVVSKKRLDMVVRDALEFFESWSPREVEKERAGHRTTSADDAPLIGAIPRHDGLYVATGHGTLGVTLGPVTAALVARELSTGKAEALLWPFRPNRFRLVF